MEQTSIKDEELKPKSKLSFKSEDEYVNSEEGIEIDGAEFVGQKAEEKAEIKLKEKKTRKGLKDRSSAAEKLTDKDGNSVLCFDVNAATDRKLTHGEKKMKSCTCRALTMFGAATYIRCCPSKVVRYSRLTEPDTLEV